MKNFMVANLRDGDKRYKMDNLTNLLKAQIENSLDLGWKIEDIIVLSNFDFEYLGVKMIKADLNSFCWTGSKVFGVKWLFNNTDIDDIVWAHDLDAWQNVEFDAPDFKDIGLTTYSRPKFNGGSIFWKRKSLDIINKIVNVLTEDNAKREEPTLNRILKLNEYKDRVTVLNMTYNVGCSGFVPRYINSFKPIRVCHFHPYNRVAWETHTLDRNGIGAIPVSRRLERLIRKYFTDLPIKLKGDHHETKNKKRIKIKVFTESVEG